MKTIIFLSFENNQNKLIMKTIIFLSFFLSSCFLAGQDSLTFNRVNDSLFVRVDEFYDDSGELKSRNEDYFDRNEVIDLLFRKSVGDLQILDELEATQNRIQKDCNQRKNYLKDSLGVSFDSLAVERFKGVYIGDWKLIERGIGVERVHVNVRVINSNPNRLRIREKNGVDSRSGTIRIVHRNRIEMRNFFGSERVDLFYVTNGIYRGKSDGIVYVLRRD